eukprot:TRINITY_DN2946_c0_g1_i1.p1 TRINITY_DN2946_c0_g1~~TRINITY_DN2946_c0_g1_i1.p1  ORF type:complete len:565 (-),score=95.56 TRINITY_DN2946_c0_g1_i1:100-1794(-)
MCCVLFFFLLSICALLDVASSLSGSVYFLKKPIESLAPYHSSYEKRLFFQYRSDASSSEDTTLKASDDIRLSHGEFHPLSQTHSGWNEVFINASSSMPLSATAAMNANVEDRDIMYAAGYVEGSLTWSVIDDYWKTLEPIWIVKPKVHDYLINNMQWMREQIKQHPTDQYWNEVALSLTHLNGMIDGYFNTHPSPYPANLTDFTFILLNYAGDLETITRSYYPKTRPAPTDPQTFMHCSALIRLLDDFSDVYIAQDTWAMYALMLRVYKHYKFELPVAGTRAVSFSSYPAYLASTDDFYITYNKLVVLETTNNIFNSSVYDLIAQTNGIGVLSNWVRNIVANNLATNGQQWSSLFTRLNSGTYPNQWMIVDLKLFQKGKPATAGFFTVVEEMPGFSHTEDLTATLFSQKYWPSYNIPFFKDVYLNLGYDTVSPQSAEYDYDKASRAQIYKRDAVKVKSFADFKELMQLNDYRTDPLSGNDPTHAIAARGDLAVHAGPWGAIDVKAVNAKGGSSLSCTALSGPTHFRQPAYNWKQFPYMLHFGQPEEYNFDYVMQCPDPSKVSCF